MRLQVTSDSDKLIIIGDSGEASLVSALSRAVEVSDPSELPDTAAIWIRSVAIANRVISRVAVARILIDRSLISEYPLAIVDGRGVAIPVRTIDSELERRFGRVYPALAESLEQFAREVNEPSFLASTTRRMLELLVSLAILLVALPVLAIVTIVFRLAFGPSRFLRERDIVGQGNSTLLLRGYDPRPLSAADASRRQLAAESVNRNIHRVHLNGVPALGEILRGRMALIGPNAIDRITFEQAVRNFPVFEARSLVRPGLISLARVRLRTVRSDYDVRRSMEYDLYYIKHRSLWMDVKILGRAFFILISDVLATLTRLAGTSLLLIGRQIEGISRRTDPSAASLSAPPIPISAAGGENSLAPVLLIGGGAGAALLLAELQRNRSLGYWPVAIVDDDYSLTGTRLHGVPILGPSMATRAIVAREHIEAIIVAVPSATSEQMQRLLRIAHSTGVPVLTMPGIGQLLRGVQPSSLIAVPVNDLLGRPVVETNSEWSREFLKGKRVLVTGAVGSIGKEVVYQALGREPAIIFGMDINESDLYDLQQELRRRELTTQFLPVIGSVCDREQVRRILEQTRPNVVFHAAAYKHVPLMEEYPHEAVHTNVGGTMTMAMESARAGVDRFVMVSTDKAVNPSSVMGASKRIAELVVQEIDRSTSMSTCSVRFGNVLGSRGSVIPLFERQIQNGGPVTLTDPGMLRYFMTIPEAAGLIIEAGAFGDGGVVYMLDMGEPVRIVDLATRLIELKGLRPGVDIELQYTGLRPGEKLFEELSLGFEQASPTANEKIRILAESDSLQGLSPLTMAENLVDIAEHGTADDVRRLILQMVREADSRVLTAV